MACPLSTVLSGLFKMILENKKIIRLVLGNSFGMKCNFSMKYR